jgi:hypothetical protein
MSTERKNPIKRDQVSTSRQLGKDPRLNPPGRPSETETDNRIRDSRIRAARSMSREV